MEPRMTLSRRRSESYQDVYSVGSELRQAGSSNTSLTAVQVHENDEAEVVLMCEPEGTSLMMGGLHPRASLYERPVNLDTSKAQHARFREVLREAGVKVLTVREVLSYAVEGDIGARVELEDLAMKALNYAVEDGVDLEELNSEDRSYLGDGYKREVVEGMGINQLIEVLLVNPTVWLSPSSRDTGFKATYEFKPLSNLVYTRDQQITTCRGIVMGKLRSSQRQLEVDLLSFCFTKLGLQVLGEISEGGYLEGGDFFPAGLDLCFIGVGLRSNMAACTELMESDWLGTRRVAIVKDEFDQHQDRMHLDCVFNIVGPKCCLILEDVLQDSSPIRRLVDEYVKNQATGKYELSRRDIEFGAFLHAEGYNLVPISAEHQLAYACNVLNLGNGNIISVHLPSARQLVRSQHFEGTVKVRGTTKPFQYNVELLKFIGFNLRAKP